MTHNLTDITEVHKRDWADNDYLFWEKYGITRDMLAIDGCFCIEKFTHGFFKQNPYLTYTRTIGQCYGWKFDRKTFIFMPNQKPHAYSNLYPGTPNAYWFHKYPKKNKSLWIVDNYIEGRMLMNYGFDVRGIPYPGSLDFSILDTFKKYWPEINFLMRGHKSYSARLLNTLPEFVNIHTVDTFFLSRHLVDIKSIASAYGVETANEAIAGLVLI